MGPGSPTKPAQNDLPGFDTEQMYQRIALTEKPSRLRFHWLYKLEDKSLYELTCTGMNPLLSLESLAFAELTRDTGLQLLRQSVCQTAVLHSTT
jgi:hypothetical protein